MIEDIRLSLTTSDFKHTIRLSILLRMELIGIVLWSTCVFLCLRAFELIQTTLLLSD